jgi:hypothetical protein
MRRMWHSNKIVWGWCLSATLTLAIIVLTPTATSALCNYGNCTNSYLCYDLTYCVVPTTTHGYFDYACGEPHEEWEPTCWVHMCEFGVPDWFDPGTCLYQGMCGTDYQYTCSYF